MKQPEPLSLLGQASGAIKPAVRVGVSFEMTSGKHIKLALSEMDLVLLNNALSEILNGLDAIAEWEFQTRTGAQRSEAIRLLRRISDTIDGDSPQ